MDTWIFLPTKGVLGCLENGVLGEPPVVLIKTHVLGGLLKWACQKHQWLLIPANPW